MSGSIRETQPIGDARADAWVVGDRAKIASSTAEACGFRISRSLSTADAGQTLRARRSVPLVLMEIGDRLSGEEADILDQLNGQASDNRTAAIISCPLPVLDTVEARITAPYATLLCDPLPQDWAVAICTAAPGDARVAETDRTADARHLLQLTDEIARIARVIGGFSVEGGHAAIVSDGYVGYRGPPAERAPQAVTASDIRAMIRWRRKRDALFPDELFADPAWDMILDLAAARLDDVDVSVSSLCIAAAVPATTALRWIKTLTEGGIFERVADPHDGRRIHIRLADQVATRVLGFLGEARETILI